jgi:hypothetical protein
MRTVSIMCFGLIALGFTSTHAARAQDTAADAAPSGAKDVASATPSFLLKPMPIEGDFGNGWRQTFAIVRA